MYMGFAITLARHSDMACFQYQQGILGEGRLASAMAIFMNQIYSSQANVMDDIAPVIAIMPGLQGCIDLVKPNFETPQTPQ
jgi:hypothetical protein